MIFREEFKGLKIPFTVKTGQKMAPKRCKYTRPRFPTVPVHLATQDAEIS